MSLRFAQSVSEGKLQFKGAYACLWPMAGVRSYRVLMYQHRQTTSQSKEIMSLARRKD